MRMRVRFGHAAVCGPAGMRDAEAAVERRIVEFLFELGHLAHRPAETDRPIVADDGDACRVVAAVFETPQSFDQYRHDVPFRDGTDYSTHLELLQSARAIRDCPTKRLAPDVTECRKRL